MKKRDAKYGSLRGEQKREIVGVQKITRTRGNQLLVQNMYMMTCKKD